jgi:hypothetical protein
MKLEINDFRIVESLVAWEPEMTVVYVSAGRRTYYVRSILASLTTGVHASDIAMRDRLAELDLARGCNWPPSILR